MAMPNDLETVLTCQNLGEDKKIKPGLFQNFFIGLNCSLPANLERKHEKLKSSSN